MKLRNPFQRFLGTGVIGRLANDSMLYGFGQALGRVFQIVLVPVLTRVFSPAEYGVVDLVMTVAVLATMITVSGMDAALARSFYEAPDRESRRRKATTSALHRLVFCSWTTCTGPMPRRSTCWPIWCGGCTTIRCAYW